MYGHVCVQYSEHWWRSMIMKQQIKRLYLDKITASILISSLLLFLAKVIKIPIQKVTLNIFVGGHKLREMYLAVNC